ncbi:ATP-binding protein [Sphingomonas crocodyli]|uniref:histidine kinase n=1 Tax=Sphingomonas crocodyli TaxID=1979270 RepID=A0A437LWJ8_9SPHN|nr:histidine kinase [Sphingomonas crocodyli]
MGGLKRRLAIARAVLKGRPRDPNRQSTGSLTRRMIGIAALWISVLLIGGGFALDRVLSDAITRNFDSQLSYALTAMVASAEVGPDGEVRFNRPLGDQRFLEPYSGLYWQVSAPGHDPFRSRSLWDRALQQSADHAGAEDHVHDSKEFQGEDLRIIDREVRLPGSPAAWRFQVAANRDALNDQIAILRRTLVRAFAILGMGLIVLAALQAVFGLLPLRTLRRAVASVRSGEASRVDVHLPDEVAPLVEELNALLQHSETQAEEARRHAGNLAHALKTPLTVLMNEATSPTADLPDIVIRATTTMRRQVDHHLARARAVGRRANTQARSEVWPSLKAVERAMGRMHRHVTVDLAGAQDAAIHVERQDLDEILGNLIENAAKYGNGRVFVTVVKDAGFVELQIEDDGPGIPADQRGKLFERGARLDTGKPGTGLGLAIVRDVIEIYGGTISLEESEDLGGLMVRVRLPAAV